MIGLDEAGKTVILYRLKLQEVVTTIPTIGFNVESMDIGDTRFTIWDVGGNSKIRPLWRHYYANTQALIFVLDASHPERLEEARDALTTTLTELNTVPILFFANKQDVAGALSVSEVSTKMRLQELKVPWLVCPSCAMTGDGLKEGMDWLASNAQSTPMEAAANEQKSETKEEESKGTEFDDLKRKFTAIEELVHKFDKGGSMLIDQIKKVLEASPERMCTVEKDGTVTIT